VSIEGCFVELEILTVMTSSKSVLFCHRSMSWSRHTVFFETLEVANDHHRRVRAEIASQEAGTHERGNKVVDFEAPGPKR
jgi:hypothetical protein